MNISPVSGCETRYGSVGDVALPRGQWHLHRVLAVVLLLFGIIDSATADPFFIEQEFLGQVVGTPAVPLIHIEGALSNSPVVTGSISILLQFEGSGDLRALFLDQGDGRLMGLGLGSTDIQRGTGAFDYASGMWSVELMPSGLEGTFNVSASYLSGEPSPSLTTEITRIETSSASDPLIKIGGGLALSDIQPTSLRLAVRRLSDAVVIGIFYDDGAGGLEGAIFLNANLPEFASGTINYQNGVWMLDLPMPGLIEDIEVEADYVAMPASLATVNEAAGHATVPESQPLRLMGGQLMHAHLLPESVTIFLRSQATGRLLGYIEDFADGSLSGQFLYSGLIPFPIQGFICHETGGWYADLAMPGSDEDLDITVSYNYSNGPPRKLVNSPPILHGSDASPLIAFSGQTRGNPVKPYTVTGWITQQPDSLLSGSFRDLGNGQLVGRYLYQGIVPVAIQGTIDYNSGLWSVSMPYPGLVGSGSVWVCSLPAVSMSVPWDYNSDWHSDLAVCTNGVWSASSLSGSNFFNSIPWGWNGSLSLYGDYDGDAINDLTVYDPGFGDWYIQSLAGSTLAWKKNWGFWGAVPVPGDYDHNGIYDYGVFSPQDGHWYLLSDTGFSIGWGIQWGWKGAIPVSGDYGGEGRFDLAVFNSQTGRWYIRTLAGQVLAWNRQWGWSGARVVAGDYDGDDGWDLAVFDDRTGRWFIQSLSGTVLAWDLQWGWAGAIPVTGDFDGDGRFDLAVYNPGRNRWYILSLTAGVLAWER